MAERPVLVGLIPQVVVLDPGDQVSWISDAGNLRVEFDSTAGPFSSNIFQAPMGMRLLSGRPWWNKDGQLQIQAVAERTDGGPRRSDPARQIRNGSAYDTLPLRRCDQFIEYSLGVFPAKNGALQAGANSSRQRDSRP